MIFCYPGTFVVRGIHGNVFLCSAHRVQCTKLNKNNFCVSRSRLGGDTENSSSEGAYIMQYYAVKSKSVGIYTCICTRQPSEVSLRCVRKCVSLLTVHVMLAQTVNKYSLAIRRSRSDMIADVFLPHGWN